MEIHSDIDIRAPRPLVFGVFRDLAAADQHVSGIQKVEILAGPAIMEVGTRWRETRKMFGKEATEEMWVTRLEENASYRVDSESQGTKYQTTYTFRDIADGTRVSMVFEGTPVSRSAKIMNVFGFLFAGAAKKMLRADLEDLKQACESRAGTHQG